jgi:hypothetical protein
MKLVDGREMMRKFNVPCYFNGARSVFAVYIGAPEDKHHPLHFQQDWLQRMKGGVIPSEIMESLSKLKELAKKNDVSFEDLCVYALGVISAEQGEIPDGAVSRGEGENSSAILSAIQSQDSSYAAGSFDSIEGEQTTQEAMPAAASDEVGRIEEPRENAEDEEEQAMFQHVLDSVQDPALREELHNLSGDEKELLLDALRKQNELTSLQATNVSEAPTA